METDVEYFTRRASEERAGAAKAMHELEGQSHRDIAKRFEGLVRAILARERHLGLDLVSEDVT